jgi:catechol-2,3-dioxygenase
MIRTSGVDHVVLHVNDVERSKKFYTDVLGMPCTGKMMVRSFCMPGNRASPSSGNRGMHL